jgi:MFS family permease
VVRDLYEPARAARVLGYMGTAMTLTPILAPIVGGVIHVAFGWRAVYLALVLCGVAFLGLTALLVSRWAASTTALRCRWRGRSPRRDSPQRGRGGWSPLVGRRPAIDGLCSPMLGSLSLPIEPQTVSVDATARQ